MIDCLECPAGSDQDIDVDHSIASAALTIGLLGPDGIAQGTTIAAASQRSTQASGR
jgi:hypothetical protein